MTFEVRDFKGKPITVGARCRYGEGGLVEVVAISEPDADYDDELQRAVRISPRLRVRFADGSEDDVGTASASTATWADYPDGPAVELFDADDLEVVDERTERNRAQRHAKIDNAIDGAVRMLLDGLEVESIADLKRLVNVARAARRLQEALHRDYLDLRAKESSERYGELLLALGWGADDAERADRLKFSEGKR